MHIPIPAVLRGTRGQPRCLSRNAPLPITPWSAVHHPQVPVANYAVVLPESKLAFRGTDALRLDAITALSLLVLLVQVTN